MRQDAPTQPAGRLLVGIASVSSCEEFSLISTANNRHDVETFIAQRKRISLIMRPLSVGFGAELGSRRDSPKIGVECGARKRETVEFSTDADKEAV